MIKNINNIYLVGLMGSGKTTVGKLTAKKLEKSFIDLLHNSGFPDIKFEKKVDFEKLYNQRFN